MPTGSRRGHEAVAVVLDFVHPLRAAGRAGGGHWEGRLEEEKTRYNEHFAIFRAARPGVESAKKSPADSGANTGEWEISRVAAFPGQASSGLDRPLRHALRTKQR
jgi:hypothetical protein